MASRSRFLIGFIAFVSIGAASALSSPDSLNPLAPKAISDLRDAIVKGFGFQAEGMMVSGFDIRDALVGHSVAYEFDIEIDNKVLPIKLLEDVNRWDLVDFPIFSAEEDKEEGEEKRLAEQVQRPSARVLPVLSPFQLAGPMELWIQDGDDMRLSLPHDVDAGTLKKVILSDGAAVTVKGARSVSLRHPLDLPFPLNRTRRDGRPVAASAFLTMAESLRRLARDAPSPLLSLRIVGPTSLASSPSASPADKLKLKRLAPGLVELSSRSSPLADDPPASSLWPLTLLNGSEPNLLGFEELLSRVMEGKDGEESSFRLVRAEVAARTYLKMGFSVRRLLEGKETSDWSGFPGWKTRPESVTAHFEVLARVEENGKVVAERIERVQPFAAEETVLASVQTGNVSMSHVPIVHPLPTLFAL